MAHKMRIAVGVSGGGRSLANLIASQNDFPFEVAFVFSSSESAGAMRIARDAGVPALAIDFSFKNQISAKVNLYSQLRDHKIDLVVLAGFLKLLPVDSEWSGKIINIHPAILPGFGGKGMHGHHVHEAVIAAGETTSGATVHFVNERYDDGALIARSKVSLSSGETPDTLASKVFASECLLLPRVIRELAKGTLPVSGVVTLNESGDFV